MKTITIIYDPKTADRHPLFHHYDGQILPQPAFVELDLNTGEVDAIISGEIGNAMPADVWHGVRRRYPINCKLNANQVFDAITTVQADLQAVYSGSEVVLNDSTNWIGQLDSSAQEAEERLAALYEVGADIEGSLTTSIADWLGDSIWPAPAQTVSDFLGELESLNGEDNHWFVGDIRDSVFDLWADALYSGDPLPQAVAQALQEDGRCADSQWTVELGAYARGEDPASPGIKMASLEATEAAMTGDGNCVFGTDLPPVEGWHCLTQEFDFDNRSFTEWVRDWETMADMTCWIADCDSETNSWRGPFGEPEDLLDIHGPLEDGQCIWRAQAFPGRAWLQNLFQEEKKRYYGE